MFRRRLAHSLVLVGVAELAAFGCAKDLDLKPTPEPSKVVQAQFDPANPIPVLNIVPTPTGLVQDPVSGNLDLTKTAPYACEGPSTKECLAFVSGGWPTTTPITLYFSGDVDDASVMDGVQLYKVAHSGDLESVEYTATQAPRPEIPAECFDGGNGSNPEVGFGSEKLPPGDKVLIISPTSPMEPSTHYILVVKSSPGGAGLLSADKKAVEPSALFHLLLPSTNPATPDPVSADGKINNALLRNQVISQAIAAVAPGKTAATLSADEKAMVDAIVLKQGMSLFGLYTYFSSIIKTVTDAGVATQGELIFVNTWKTADEPGAAAPIAVFDPTNQIIPFPNSPMLLVPDMTVNGGLRVNLPNPTSDPTIGGLNTLNGFSTTAPIVIPVSAEVDPTTISTQGPLCTVMGDCNIVMLPVGDDGNVSDSMGVPLFIATTTTSVVVVPLIPLLQNQNYVVGVKSGLKSVDGQTLGSAQTFDFLKIEAPFIDDSGAVLEAPISASGATFKQALECSFVPTTGELGSESQVAGVATALEKQVGHQGFVAAFKALESATPSIPRTGVIMAFTYKTEDITNAVDFAKGNLERETGCSPQTPCWDDLLTGGVRVIPTPVDIQGSAAIAQAVGVVPTLCVPLCEGGAMEPAIHAMDCATRDASGKITDINPALPGHPLCVTAVQLVVSRLDRARLYVLQSFEARVGGPFQTTPGHAGAFSLATLVQPRVTSIPMWVVTGTTTEANPKFPIVVFQHGLGSQKEAGFYIANVLAQTATPLATSGYATVMIDLPFHGARASDMINNATGMPCATDPAAVTCQPDGSCTGGCDGHQDPSGTGFLGPNLFATRDNFRQGTIDQLALLRALRKESAAGGVLSYLNGGHIGYIGQSLGGITGGNLAAYLKPSEIDAVVLNVPGGGLVNNILLYTVPQISAPLFAALHAAGQCDYVVEGHPESGCKDTPKYQQFKLVAEWILDPGDPYATSIGVTHLLTDVPDRVPLTPAKILIQMSLPDPVVPNPASIALGRSYGFKTDGSDEHFQIYDFSMVPRPEGSGCHPFLLAPVCGACLFDTVCSTLGAQIQAAGFVASSGALIGPQKTNVAGLNCANPCGM